MDHYDYDPGRSFDRRIGQRAETEAVARLDHPNIVRLLDVVEEGDAIALVTQYAAHGSLADLLATRRTAAA